MSTLLKHTLNPSFALLFAVGVDRLYKVLDPVVLEGHQAAAATPGFYLPLTMVALTLWFGWLSSIANDKFMETRERASATSLVAWLSYVSILCALGMLFVSVDVAFAAYWWLGYAVLCIVNAAWNSMAVIPAQSRPHVVVNVIVALILLIIFVFYREALSEPPWFYVLLVPIGALKWWQRRQPRDFKPA